MKYWPSAASAGPKKANRSNLPSICVQDYRSHFRGAQGQFVSTAEFQAKDDAEAKKLDPAQRDLRRLCEESATRETTLVLSGVTTDTAALDRYLVALGDERMFIKVEMASLEANPEERAGTWRFSARLAVRPAYGEPGGPEGPDVKSVDRRMKTAAPQVLE